MTTRPARPVEGSTRFIYSTVGPDFVDTTTGEMLELTTPGQVYAHTLRPGYGGVTYSTYGLGAWVRKGVQAERGMVVSS